MKLVGCPERYWRGNRGFNFRLPVPESSRLFASSASDSGSNFFSTLVTHIGTVELEFAGIFVCHITMTNSVISLDNYEDQLRRRHEHDTFITPRHRSGSEMAPTTPPRLSETNNVKSADQFSCLGSINRGLFTGNKQGFHRLVFNYHYWLTAIYFWSGLSGNLSERKQFIWQG